MEDLLSRSVGQIIWLDVTARGDPRYILPESLNLVHPDYFRVSKSVRACEWKKQDIYNALSLRSYHLFVVGWRKELQRAEKLGGAESSLRKLPRHQ